MNDNNAPSESRPVVGAPCPFCGNNDEELFAVAVNEDAQGIRDGYVLCYACDARGPNTPVPPGGDPVRAAIGDWRQRFPPTDKTR